MLRDTRRHSIQVQKRRSIFATKNLDTKPPIGSDTEAIPLHNHPPVRCSALKMSFDAEQDLGA